MASAGANYAAMAHAMESKESNPAPMKKYEVNYTEMDTGDNIVYLLRSDGKIDRSTGSGKISHRISPSGDFKYIYATGGASASYFLRSDGKIDRTTGGGKISSTIAGQGGAKIIGVSAGLTASYALQDDGRILRITGKNAAVLLPAASEGAKYTAVSAGTDASYFLRDDGKVDRSYKAGEISHTISGPMAAPYIAIATQSIGQGNGKGQYAAPTHAYFIRSDGKVDRSKNGEITSTIDPPGDNVKFVSASAGNNQSYLIADDGKAYRIGPTAGGVPDTVMDAVEGCKYILASSGDSGASYLLRDDGQVDRATNKSFIAQSMNTAQDAEKSCLVM